MSLLVWLKPIVGLQSGCELCAQSSLETMCFPVFLAITLIQRFISELLVRFQIPKLKWDQVLMFDRCMEKQKPFLVRDGQMVTVLSLDRPEIRCWCGMKLAASLAS